MAISRGKNVLNSSSCRSWQIELDLNSVNKLLRKSVHLICILNLHVVTNKVAFKTAFVKDVTLPRCPVEFWELVTRARQLATLPGLKLISEIESSNSKIFFRQALCKSNWKSFKELLILQFETIQWKSCFLSRFFVLPFENQSAFTQRWEKNISKSYFWLSCNSEIF